MNKFFEKINLVFVLRVAGVFLFALYLIQAFMNSGRGAAIDDQFLIFVVGVANGLFQPLVLLGLAELIKIKQVK